MMNKFSAKPLLAITLIASTALLMPQRTQACGPFFTDAIFVYTKHPDFPLERFAEGRLGILQPSYARSYLFVAYRNLIGATLSEAEKAALKSLWDDRLNHAGEIRDEEWVKKWLDARSKVPGLSAPLQISAFRRREKPNEYETYLNCQQDAFDNAAATLGERIKRFGADSAQVREWVSAQDTVFSDCASGAQLPEPVRPDQEATIRADRAYQIAAANFYAGNFDEATRQFDAIARDAASPWHAPAQYLAARALLRKGSFAEKDEERRGPLTSAESRLNAIMNDRSSSHEAARRLLKLARLRLRPEERVHELAHSIVEQDNKADFKQDVWDYTVLLDKFIGDESDEKKAPVVPASLRNDDLTDWLLTFQDITTEAATHARERWEKTHALPWLVAALAKATGQQPGIDSLLNASAVDPSSPAFPSLAFHRVRLLIESKRSNEARAMLDKIIAVDRSLLPASAVNQLLGQRTMLAASLEEFLQSVQRVPAGFSDDSDGREIPEDQKELESITKGSKFFFDLDAANVFNRAMPVGIMRDAARSAILPANLHRDVTQATFERAALLDDRESAIEAAKLLAEIYPQTKTFLSAYQNAATPEARRFAAVFISLKFPGLRPYVVSGVGRTTAVSEIDSFRDNYWCAEPPTSMTAADGKAKTKISPKPSRLSRRGF